MDGSESFGSWLKQRRREYGYTQQELADLVGCSAVTILKLEAGERRPSAQIAELLAVHLEVPAAERAAFAQFARGPKPAQSPTPSPWTEQAGGHAETSRQVLPPTGILTLLLAGIDDRAEQREGEPEAAEQARDRFVTLIREVVPAHEGYLFSATGGACYAVFPSAAEALMAALEGQRALLTSSEGEPSSVRMALHTGIVERQDSGYAGQPISRAYHLLQAGHGGQILLTVTTEELVRDRLPGGVTLRHLGEHRLKDLQRPERIFEVAAPEAPWSLPATFPPLRTLTSHPNNLPVERSRLVGREEELEQLTEMLLRPDTGVVTLLGVGGTGKTRLALQVAADLVDRFEDGVFFVDLAPVRDPTLLVSTIAQSLDIKEAGGQALFDTLVDYLRGRHLLLVLDNFEQVMEAAPQVAQLLGSAPRLKVLVTSRSPLQLRGEWEFPVPALDLPDLDSADTPDDVAQCSAVRLFVERAAQVKPDFQLTPENAHAVAEICIRLDGLPLAIELAAARIRILSPEAMLARLQKSLQLLTGGAQDLPDRQRTLKSAIQWSYDLLTADEQRLFRRLSVFPGGCTLESAEAVCYAEMPGIDPVEIDTLDGIESLVRKNLLRARGESTEPGYGARSAGEPRFYMLQTIQEFAGEQLQASGEALQVQDAHLQYFLKMAEQAEGQLRGPRQVEWLERLEVEHDNMRAALAWAEEANRLEAALRLAGALGRFWFAHGHLSEGRKVLEWLLERNGGQPPGLRAKALNAAGRLAVLQGDYEMARAWQEQALEIYRSIDDKRGTGQVMNDLGNIFSLQGDYASRERLNRESLALFRDIGDESGLVGSLFQLGGVLVVLGDTVGGRQHVEEGLAIVRKLGDKRGIAMSLFVLGNFARSAGDNEAARPYYNEALPLFRELRDRVNIANVLSSLGNIATVEGEYVEARSLLEEALATFKMLGARRGISDSLVGLAYLARKAGDQGEAASLYRQALQIRWELGNKRGVAECLEGLAAVAADRGDARRTALLFGAAEAQRNALSSPLPAADRAEYEPSMTWAREALGETGWEDARQEGAAMPLDDAVAAALGG